MLDSVMFWNEPNNLSHWDFQMDEGWQQFAKMVRWAGEAVHAANPQVRRVMGGLSPVDPEFAVRLGDLGALAAVDVMAIHGFPLDWNYWHAPDNDTQDPQRVATGIHAWPRKIDLIRRVSGLPVWVTEVGVSSFGAEEVQAWGLRATLDALAGVERAYWYTLFDLPEHRAATTRHKESEGSSYYRHYHMGLLTAEGRPKAALAAWPVGRPNLGLCQWFHMNDGETLERSVALFKQLGVTHVRTGISWADSHVPGAWEWFDRQMEALAPFTVLATLCFTPPSRGQRADHTSPPVDLGEYAWFCGEVVRRYAPPAPAYVAPAPAAYTWG